MLLVGREAMSPMPDSYATSVFVNCPYDREFVPLLRAMIFAVVAHGLRPRTASDSFVSNHSRMDKILDLIPACRYSIHDLSRVGTGKGGLARFNMPFEMGIDWGHHHYLKRPKDSEKLILVLEAKSNTAKRALSDFGGYDCLCHGGRPQQMMRAVRDFFYDKSIPLDKPDRPEPDQLWRSYIQFNAHLELRKDGSKRPVEDIVNMPVAEFVDKVEAWRAGQQL